MLHRPDTPPVAGVVFDKDGTLLDFAATWDPAIALAIDALADGDPDVARHIAAPLGYDMDERATLPGAPLLASSNAEVVALVPDGHRGDALPALLAEFVLDTVTAAPHAEELLTALEELGIPAAVATNDDEASAVTQLAHLSWSDRFVSILGFDSGHGAKPESGMILEACRRMGIDAASAMMVGDSPADIHAGRAAGATTVYVGTDPARGADADHWIETLHGAISLIS